MKILFVGEFSKIATGYGKISSELTKRFHEDGYEIAELATFCDANHPLIKDCPWKVYPNVPLDPKEKEEFNSNPQNSNGKYSFEKVLLDFQPTHVFANGDPFFYEYQNHSPFKDYFNWIITAPVDGIPQHNQWIEIFNSADGLVSYTEWGKNVLENYNLKVDGIMPPVASDDFFPAKQDQIELFKKTINVDGKVIGTVMRNQPRKLFDKLFESFALLIEKDPSLRLYCHTTYPDAGWDLPELLIKHDIISNVLFTYKCKNCKNIFPSYFHDMVTYCGNCKQTSATMPDGHNNVDNATLNKIFNIFDVYVQLASREGFGIPQIEAAACDIPVVTMDYAGMTDIINNIGAYKIELLDKYLSYPMNMMEALPSIDSILKNLKEALNNNEKGTGKFRNAYLNYYKSWDKTYNNIKNIIDNLPPKQWKSKTIKPIPDYDETDFGNEFYVMALIDAVLEKPELVNSYLMTRLVRDLNFGMTFGGICGNYFTESHDNKNYIPFSRKKAYDIIRNKREYNDYWQSLLNQKLKD